MMLFNSIVSLFHRDDEGPGTRGVRTDPRPHRDRRDHRPHLPRQPGQDDPQHRRHLHLASPPTRSAKRGGPEGGRPLSHFHPGGNRNAGRQPDREQPAGQPAVVRGGPRGKSRQFLPAVLAHWYSRASLGRCYSGAACHTASGITRHRGERIETQQSADPADRLLPRHRRLRRDHPPDEPGRRRRRRPTTTTSGHGRRGHPPRHGHHRRSSSPRRAVDIADYPAGAFKTPGEVIGQTVRTDVKQGQIIDRDDVHRDYRGDHRYHPRSSTRACGPCRSRSTRSPAWAPSSSRATALTSCWGSAARTSSRSSRSIPRPARSPRSPA